MSDASQKAFQDALVGLLREAGREVFAPDVQEFVQRIIANDVCPECRYVPPRPTGVSAFAMPIRSPGVTHHGDCPTVPQMSREQREALNKRLDELAKARIDNRRYL